MFVPMKAGKLKPQVERTYRESHALQWVREALINAKEAGAKHIHFGIEWNGVAATNTYRRVIADDGCGISPADHERFFNTFGSGGKPIGGVHQNYGIGFKTSVLPWNQCGVVIISLRDGETSMSRIYLDQRSDEYGMLAATNEDGELVTVWGPGEDDDVGIDWSRAIPKFVADAGHGTVIVLLGNDYDQDTILGDPERPSERNVDAIVRYINTRFWELDGIDVSVDVVQSENKSRWPAAYAAKSGGGREASWATLRPTGLFDATVNRDTKDSKLVHQGTVSVAGGAVNIDWYLREGAPLPSTRAQSKGFVAALYRNEVYALQDHASTMRMFGVNAIRDNTFLLIRVPEFDDASGQGVYPDTSRTGLKLAGERGGVELPMHDWAQDFASHLPSEIIQAITSTYAAQHGDLNDESWKQRLQERFGRQWRIPKLMESPNGSFTVKPVQPIGKVKDGNPLKSLVRKILKENTPAEGNARVGSADPTGALADQKMVAGGLPGFDIVSAERIGENGKWALAAYEPPSAANPAGTVLINRDHAVLKQHISELANGYPSHLAEEVEHQLHQVYGELAVAHVAHSEQMKKLMPATSVEQDLRSETALTMAMLGLWGAESIVTPRLQAKLQRPTPRSS